MNLGGSTYTGSNVPKHQTTNFDQLSEVNKKLRTLDKTLCCKLDELISKPSSVTIESSCITPVYTSDCGTADIIAELKKIYGAVDDIELTADNIKIEAGQINLNTDEVEQLLTDIKELIVNVGKYNTEEQHRVTGSAIDSDYASDDTLGNTHTFPQNTYHSIAIYIEEGSGSITINGKKNTHKAGYTKTFTATEFLLNSIKVDAVSTDAVITITTVK